MMSSAFVLALLACGFEQGKQPVRRAQHEKLLDDLHPGLEAERMLDQSKANAAAEPGDTEEEEDGSDKAEDQEEEEGADADADEDAVPLPPPKKKAAAHGPSPAGAPAGRKPSAAQAESAPAAHAGPRRGGQAHGQKGDKASRGPGASKPAGKPAVAAEDTRPPPVGLSAKAALDSLLPAKEEDDFKSSLLAGVLFALLFGAFLYVNKPLFYTLDFFTSWSFPFWGFAVAAGIFYMVTEFLVDRVFPDGGQKQKAYRFLLGYVLYGCGAFVFHILDGVLGPWLQNEQKSGQKSELIKSGQTQKADLKIQKLRIDIFWTLSALSVAVPSYIVVAILIGLAHAAKEIEKTRAPYSSLET